MTGAPLLECVGITAGYDTKKVLHGIDLRIQAGERVVLLGPNGSGKSTLLKTISKTLRPTEGEVRLGGDSLASMSFSEMARRLAYVPQEEASHFPFLVRDVVLMGRLARSNGLFDTPEDRVAADSAMERADCAELADRPYTELSGGERQRVLIARALAQETPAILLDEPSAHLDPAHQVGVADMVRGLADAGTATLSAVHDLNLAARMATRAILLHGGKIGMDAPVEDVLRSPLLDEVYRVRFERVEAGGRLAVLPISVA